MYRLSIKWIFLILSSFCRAKGFPEHMASFLVCAQENIGLQWILRHTPEIHYTAFPAGRGPFFARSSHRRWLDLASSCIRGCKNMKKSAGILTAIACFFAGMVFGFFISPVKQGIGNNSGNNNGNTYLDRSEIAQPQA